jgi:hypothetical protein
MILASVGCWRDPPPPSEPKPEVRPESKPTQKLETQPAKKLETNAEQKSVAIQPSKLRGEWEGTVDGQPVSLYFDARKTSRLRVGKKDGAWKDDREGTFVVDWTTSPARLDIEWGKSEKIHSIIEQTDDSLKVESLTPGAPRPMHFTDKATVLKRDNVKYAKNWFRMIEYVIGTYWLTHSQIPSSLQALIDAKLIAAEDVMDPWGQPYQYDPAGKRNEGNPYSISSVPGRIHKIKRPDIWTEMPDKRILGNWPDDKR